MNNDYYGRQRKQLPISTSASTPDKGTLEDPNPGEAMSNAGSEIASAYGMQVEGKPGQAGKPRDFGAQVGIMRNLEFTAGGRAHRISTGPYTKA